MKKLSLALLFLVVFLFSCAKKEANKDTSTEQTMAKKVITVAFEGAYPPFSDTDKDGNVIGFDIDIAKAICTDLKDIECKFVVQDWDGMIPALLAKKFDIIVASMSNTKERAEKIDFTNPYYKTGLLFVSSAGNIDSINKNSLSDKKIGVQKATTSHFYLKEKYTDIVDIRAYDTQAQAQLDLQSQRIDGFVADYFVALGFLSTDKGKAFKSVGEVIQIDGSDISIAIRKNNDDLKNKINQSIANIRNNGQYEQISNKYFGVNIYKD